MAETRYILSEQTVRELRELARTVQELGGVQAIKRAVERGKNEGHRVYLARVVSSTATSVVDANANPVQWTYEIERVAKVKAGATSASNTGVWQSFGANYTYSPAYRLIEDGNTGTGRQKYGIDHDGELVDGVDQAMQPLQDGTIVTFIFVPVTTAAGELSVEPWITGTWASIDGTCGADT